MKVEKREKDSINAVKLKYFKNEQSAAKPAKEGSETNSMSVGTLVPKQRPPCNMDEDIVQRITPQPNKYAEILMPRYPIDRATNFIVEDESWSVVEYDHTSVPGVIYLSMTEGKVNLIYDDLENNIADTDKLANYELSTPLEIQNFSVGQPINPVFTLTKNGEPCEAEVTFITQNKKIARMINGILTAVGEGETTIIVQLVEFPNITTTINVKVNNEEPIFSAYIEGSEKIRLDRDSIYYLIGTTEINEPVTFSIDTELASIIKVKNNKCIIHANDKNLLGDFTLFAEYRGITYTKTLTIIPLWQVI